MKFQSSKTGCSNCGGRPAVPGSRDPDQLAAPANGIAGDVGTDMTAAAFRQPNDRACMVIRLMRRPAPTIAPGAFGVFSSIRAPRSSRVILYDQVETLTRSSNVSASVVLGHDMANELGHVLSRSSEHTSGGLMQACWTAANWRLASAGLVVFDRAEIKRMRAALPNSK